MTDKKLTIVHFNDVYEVTETDKEPVGGVARFQTFVKQVREKYGEILVVFSGDVFSPSVTSSVTGGKHFIEILNPIGIDIGTLGNHDFDFGLDACIELSSQLNFPWMMANVEDPQGNTIANSLRSKLIEKNGIKIGLVGLVEREWLDTVICFGKGAVVYKDQVECGKKLTAELREQGAEIIIAVTHSRLPNDIHLAMNSVDIDLILGGHDHDFYVEFKNKIPIINSGSNFKNASLLHLSPNSSLPSDDTREDQISPEKKTWKLYGNRWNSEIIQIDITKQFAPDPEMEKIVFSVSDLVNEMKKKVIGHTGTVWDARSSVVRTQESSIGNFLADTFRTAYKCDVALIHGGNIRSNLQFGPGEITMGTVMEICPYTDSTVVFELQGKYLREALENGFSQWPKQEGRFPQVSGVWLQVDYNSPPGSRIKSILIGDKENKQPLDENKLYSLATKPYLLSGGDGYTSLTNHGRILVDEECGHTNSTLVRNFFLEKRVLLALNKQARLESKAKAFLGIQPEIKLREVNFEIEGRIVDITNK